MINIKIKSHVKFCLSQNDGKILRNIIEPELNKGEKIILDFSGISLFASPFFNISVGHFITNMGIKKYNENIEVINLSVVGQKVYQKVTEHASSKDDSDKIDDINNIIKDVDK